MTKAMTFEEVTPDEVDRLMHSEKWAAETKLDGVRCVADVTGGDVTLMNRNGKPLRAASTNAHRPAIEKALRAQNLSPEKINEGKQWWSAANLIVQNIGAFFGMIVFSKLAHGIGRKKAFAIGFICAFAATIFFYRSFKSKADI